MHKRTIMLQFQFIFTQTVNVTVHEVHTNVDIVSEVHEQYKLEKK